MEEQSNLLSKVETAIDRCLDTILRQGTFTDVIDQTGEGAFKSQRLSNVIGLNELRLLRSSLRKELGLDNTPSNIDRPGTTMPILSLIQSGSISLPQIQSLGTKDE